MSFRELMDTMTSAACAGDGADVANCFTPDGTYHDVFYGAFSGRTAIADMIVNHFHRDGRDFRWDLYDAVDDGRTGYVRYVFSYSSKLEGREGRRSVFEGVSVCKLKDGLIAEYTEVGNAATGLSMMGFSPQSLARFIARQADELTSREETSPHLAKDGTQK